MGNRDTEMVYFIVSRKGKHLWAEGDKGEGAKQRE